jgi:hypothetical protein
VLPLSKRIDVSGHDDPAIVAKGSRRGVPRPSREARKCVRSPPPQFVTGRTNR